MVAGVWPAVLCGLIYLLIAGGFRCRYVQTDYAHHVYVADAFLHGQLHLRPEALEQMENLATQRVDAELALQARASGRLPTPEERLKAIQEHLNGVTLLDWSVVDHKLYGYWGPLTPAVFVPFVAAFGTGISDSLLTALFGAVNVALFYRLLRRVDAAGLLPMTEPGRIALTLGLGLGTVHFYMSCFGTVWFTAQIVALTAMLAACLAATSVRNRPRDVLLSGIFFGAALLGRTIVGAMLPFFVVLIYARTNGLPARARAVLRRLAVFALPCVVAVLLQGAYNYGRFGGVFESGQAELLRQTGNPLLTPDYEQYGQFHPHFLARNAKYYLWNWTLPLKDEPGTKPSDQHAGGTFLVTPLLRGIRGEPMVCEAFDPNGNSMFLVTPLFLYALFAWRRRTTFTLGLACGALPFLAALLLFRATGWVQFGNRYLLESLPLWLLLAAAGMRGRLTVAGYVLLVLSIAVNLCGTYCMCEAMFQRIAPYIGPYLLPSLTALALLAGAWSWLHRPQQSPVSVL